MVASTVAQAGPGGGVSPEKEKEREEDKKEVVCGVGNIDVIHLRPVFNCYSHYNICIVSQLLSEWKILIGGCNYWIFFIISLS